jgi:DNA-binding NtrC family response regulator
MNAELLIDALKPSGGDMRKSAKRLKTGERIFGYKVNQYGIPPNQYR